MLRPGFSFCLSLQPIASSLPKERRLRRVSKDEASMVRDASQLAPLLTMKSE
jgi:hypothetical protein